jgi:butyryl-CoA dehydrogenase
MLLLQKAVVEGSLSLLVECSKYADLAHVDTTDVGSNSQLLLELLTPVAKTYPAEMGRVAINNGLQVLGGYGYCMDFPLQQYLRDIRIMSIYEGTTGIQSLDLLGRKVPLENGKAMSLLTARISEVIKAASEDPQLKPYGEQLAKKMEEIQKALGYLMPYAIKGEYETYLADATVFMEMASNIIIGWQWLKIAVAASRQLQMDSRTFEKSFYESKIHTMKFYFKYELPKTRACLETLTHPDKLTLTLDTDDSIF